MTIFRDFGQPVMKLQAASSSSATVWYTSFVLKQFDLDYLVKGWIWHMGYDNKIKVEVTLGKEQPNFLSDWIEVLNCVDKCNAK